MSKLLVTVFVRAVLVLQWIIMIVGVVGAANEHSVGGRAFCILGALVLNVLIVLVIRAPCYVYLDEQAKKALAD